MDHRAGSQFYIVTSATTVRSLMPQLMMSSNHSSVCRSFRSPITLSCPKHRRLRQAVVGNPANSADMPNAVRKVRLKKLATADFIKVRENRGKITTLNSSAYCL